MFLVETGESRTRAETRFSGGCSDAYQFAEYGEGAAFEGYFETQSPRPIAERTDKGHAALYAYVS